MLVAAIKLYENSESVQKYKKSSLGKKKEKKPQTHYQIQGKLSVVQLSLKRINQDKYIKKMTYSTEWILHKLYFNTECKVIKKFSNKHFAKRTNSLDITDQC